MLSEISEINTLASIIQALRQDYNQSTKLERFFFGSLAKVLENQGSSMLEIAGAYFNASFFQRNFLSRLKPFSTLNSEQEKQIKALLGKEIIQKNIASINSELAIGILYRLHKAVRLTDNDVNYVLHHPKQADLADTLELLNKLQKKRGGVPFHSILSSPEPWLLARVFDTMLKENLFTARNWELILENEDEVIAYLQKLTPHFAGKPILNLVKEFLKRGPYIEQPPGILKPAEQAQQPSPSNLEPAEQAQQPSASNWEPAEQAQQPSPSNLEPAEQAQQPSPSNESNIELNPTQKFIRGGNLDGYFNTSGPSTVNLFSPSSNSPKEEIDEDSHPNRPNSSNLNSL